MQSRAKLPACTAAGRQKTPRKNEAFFAVLASWREEEKFLYAESAVIWLTQVIRLFFYLGFLLCAWLGTPWPSATEASHGREEINYIGPERVRALIDAGEKMFFIDIRPSKEYQEKRVAGARSVPVAELEKRLSEIPKAGRIVLYCACRAGGEDADAFFLLRDNGYRNVAVMEEGFPGWLRRKYPIEAGGR